MSLSKAHMQALLDRGIRRETIEAMGIYSGKHSDDGSVIADPKGNILCFPFFEGLDEINTKYRWKDKDGNRRFMQKPNAPKTFFNVNALRNERNLINLEAGADALVITEGEVDCMSSIDAGYDISVSVPDGAPPARDKDGQLIEVPDDATDVDPDDDAKYSFLRRNWEYLDRCKTIIVATDDDEPGRRLAKEIVRRVGAARCRWVQFPNDAVVTDLKTGEVRPCKDLNEVHLHFGIDAVRDILDNSREWPVKGLYTIDDYPEAPEPVTYETGLSKEMDEHFRPYPGAFIVVTGIPGMGKSTLVNQISVQMAKVHGWKIGMFSGEMPTVPYISNALMTTFLRKHRKKWTPEDRKAGKEFLRRNYVFIDQNVDDDADEFDIDGLIELAQTAVFRYGIRMLIIDPWNELEHTRDRHISLTEYVGNAIRKLKRFAKNSGCCVFLVAHPKKLDDGARPGLYSISDSANFANKADLSLVVHAEDAYGTQRNIIIPKVRFSSAGKKGEVEMDFDTELENFVPKIAAPF